jgi:hypothetical protein
MTQRVKETIIDGLNREINHGLIAYKRFLSILTLPQGL